jgi:hypothetical protein
MRRLKCASLSLLVVLTLLPLTTFSQQGYPGAAFFSYQCIPGGIQFLFQGSPVIEATFAEIAVPLSVAVGTHQNQPVKIGTDVGLWALQSNELQIHQNKDHDGTKLVLSSSICGAIPLASVTGTGAFSGQALAYVQLTCPGEAFAYAEASPLGNVVFAQISGCGQAGAVAQSNGEAPQAGMNYHIVVAGENLFRIALRYNTTVSILASINHISDPTLIYVGQKIYLP